MVIVEDIIFLSPDFKERIWGGNKLNTKFGYDIPSENTGECWAIAGHPNGSSTVRLGEYKGMTLGELWDEHRDLFGNMSGDRFPLMVKIIDAKEDLSIQVHPNDEYAMKNEKGSFGKTECWYVLDAPEGSSLVIGHNAQNKEQMISMIDNGQWKDLLHEVPVKKGDFVQINPGTLHAIKGGLMILETQQNSDITYRVYDYDRVTDGKKRELHLDKAKEVTDILTNPEYDYNKKKLAGGLVLDTSDAKMNTMYEMFTCKYYTIYKFLVSDSVTVKMTKPFMLMSVVEGAGTANGTYVEKGDNFIVPAGVDEFTLCGTMEVVASTI